MTVQRFQKKKMAERTLNAIPSAIVDGFAARQSLSVLVSSCQSPQSCRAKPLSPSLSFEAAADPSHPSTGREAPQSSPASYFPPQVGVYG